MDDHNYSKSHTRPKSIIFTSQIFGEPVPEEGSDQYFNPKQYSQKLGGCGLIPCDVEGHCKGWHCPICHKTGQKYQLKNHIFTVHWASRVVVGGINSLLCKCQLPERAVTPRHWHCPYCGCNPYYKLKYLVFHITRVHKPNEIVKGYSQRKLAFTVDCTKSDEAEPSSQRNSAVPNDNTYDFNDLRTDTWTPKRKVKGKDYSFIGKHGCNAVRCEVAGHCRGWHCTLCPYASQKYRVRNHLAAVHWASRFEVDDKAAVMCKCDETLTSGLRHWHCPYCNNKFVRPRRLILHVLGVHKPTSPVKRYSFGKMVKCFNRVGEAVKKIKPEEELKPEPIPDTQQHISEVIVRCIAPGHCKGWHCSYCTATGLRYKIKNHLQAVHYGSRLEFDNQVSFLCKCNNFKKKTPRHWHCPLCTDHAFAKSKGLLRHVLKTHRPTMFVKRYCHGKLVTDIPNPTKPDPPSRRRDRSITESLLYNGSCIDLIGCDVVDHCDGWHCPLCHKTGKKYMMRQHFQTIHWASRVQVGGMKSILCKCPLTNLKEPRHYHCPLCTDRTFPKSVFLQKHILKEHKPTADVEQYSRNQVVSVMECESPMELIETMEAIGAMEKIDTTGITETTEGTLEETMEMETIRLVDKSRDQQIDWDMVKCTEPMHCEEWHCTLCTTTGDVAKLKQHFFSHHRASRVEAGDLSIITCKCRKVSGLGHQHWHCPLCINRSFSRILTLAEHFVRTHKPVAVVKRFSRGNLVTTHDYTKPAGVLYIKEESIILEDETIDVPQPKQDCSVVKCTVDGHCLGWHCPFCSASGDRYRMKNHIQSVHWGSRVVIGDTWSVLCKCKKTNKSTPRHWHCPLCADSTFVKACILEKHFIVIHRTLATIKRFSRGKLVAVDGVPVTGDVNKAEVDLPPPILDKNLATPSDRQLPTQPDGQLPTQPDGQLPTQPDGQLPTQPDGQLPTQPDGQLPTQPDGQLPTQPDGQLPTQPDGQLPTQPDGQLPTQPNGQLPTQPDGQLPTQPDGQLPTQPDGQLPIQPDGQLPTQPDGQLPTQPNGQLPIQPDGQLPIQPDGQLPTQPDGQLPTQPDGQLPIQPDGQLPIQPDGQLPIQLDGQLPTQPDGQLPTQHDGQLPTQPDGQLPTQPDGQLPTQPDGQLPTQPDGQLPTQPDGQLPTQPDGQLATLNDTDVAEEIISFTSAWDLLKKIDC